MDPRTSVIEERLRGIRRIVAVAGGKGGVGKSLVSCSLALSLSSMGYKTGLLDLDFSSPSDHLILGINLAATRPDEDSGIVPRDAFGIRFLSLAHYSGKNPSPLRGIDVSNVLREMLCITKWGNLDVLVVDMPPGTGEAFLDSAKLFRRMEFIAVTTPSLISVGSVVKFLALARELKVPVMGVLENMRQRETSGKFFGKDFLGSVRFDPEIEMALGSPERLAKTGFSREMRELIRKIF